MDFRLHIFSCISPIISDWKANRSKTQYHRPHIYQYLSNLELSGIHTWRILINKNRPIYSLSFPDRIESNRTFRIGAILIGTPRLSGSRVKILIPRYNNPYSSHPAGFKSCAFQRGVIRGGHGKFIRRW